jgi:hypothetical protein
VVAVKDVMVKIREESAAFENLNGILKIDNDLWEQSISGNIGESDFTIQGNGLNLSSLFKGDKTLEASMIFRSNYFNFRELLDQFAIKTDEEHAAVTFPANIDLRLDFVVNDFVKDLLRASNLRGIARYDSPFLKVSDHANHGWYPSRIVRTGAGSQGTIYSNVQAVCSRYPQTIRGIQ